MTDWVDSRREFHRRHDATLVRSEDKNEVWWTCACGAKGHRTRDTHKAWKGYYAHVGRAAKKELGRS